MKIFPALLPIVLCGTMLGAEVQFKESLIAENLRYPYGIAAGDLNGDGRTDITLADARKSNAVYWFENDGTGKFDRYLIHHQPPPAWRLERHALADMDRDGRLDVVVVENSTGDLLWLENPGPPSIRSPWRPHFITLSSRVPGAYDVDIGDVDGDGWPDVVASSWRIGNMFSWHQNPGRLLKKGESYTVSAATENNWAEWKQYNIAENFLETRMVRLADIDGDGDLDLVGTATRGGHVVWLENPGKDAVTSELHPYTPGYGTKLLWTVHIIDKTGRPAHGQVGDMDGDGDIDVVLASGMAANLVPSEVMPVSHEVAWYENLGSGKRWTKRVIQKPFPQAFEAVTVDFDGDGDMDVAATAWIESTGIALAWFENARNNEWIMHPLKENWPRAAQLVITDVDGDGRPDIVASAEDGSSELRWWQNLKSP